MELPLEYGETYEPHVHRDLVPVREGGDGPRIGLICPGCYSLFHPVTGKPLARGTKGWAAVLEQMTADLKRAPSNTPGPLGRLIRWLQAGAPETP